MAESVTLPSGAKMPLFGLGTWQADDAESLKIALVTALDAGYRLIDTASIYGNEAIIGEVLETYFKSGKLKRTDVFITTKLPFYSMDPKDADELIPKQLANLRTDYVDLYLLHNAAAMKQADPSKPLDFSPGSFIHQDIPHIETWKVLEKYYKKGNLKALGVSNFNGKQIQELYNLAEIKPANLQVECHIYWPQFELHELCKKLNMSFTSYATLGSPGRTKRLGNHHWPEGNPMQEPLVVQLAQKYGKTPAQILLRQMMQRQIVVIPKSTNASRVVENANVFDFQLTPAEVQQLNEVKTRVRLFEMRVFKGNKKFPFEDVDLSIEPQ